MFYRATDKEMLDLRNKIFLESCLDVILEEGFVKAPFPNSYFGRNNLSDFSYEFGRIKEGSILELLQVGINRGDKWIKIFLNIFKLMPEITSFRDLENSDVLKFHLPPNSSKRMRLRLDDYVGMPLFNLKGHKIGRYWTPKGLQNKANILRNLLVRDLKNIDSFIESWYRIYAISVTNWDGEAWKESY